MFMPIAASYAVGSQVSARNKKLTGSSIPRDPNNRSSVIWALLSPFQAARNAAQRTTVRLRSLQA